MERWAANTLRGFGIFLTAILLVAATLLLLLMSFCSWNGGWESSPNHSQAIGYLVCVVFVLAIGIFIISRLARGIVHSAPGGMSASGQPQPAQSAVPVYPSAEAGEALRNLIYAITASIAIGVIFWGISLHRWWTTLGSRPSGAFPYAQSWLIAGLISAALHYLPYVILLIRLHRKPDRLALAFAIGIPVASILHTATALPLMWRILAYRTNFSQTLLPMGIGVALQILILIFAWRANQRLGYRQEAVSLIIACAASYAYFIIFGSANAWLYRFIR